MSISRTGIVLAWLAALLAVPPAQAGLKFVAKRGASSALDGMSEVTASVLSPGGAHLYVTNLDGAVLIFARNASTGELAYLDEEVDGVGGVDGLTGASAIAISPDGANVYVAGFDDNAIAVFSRNPTTGLLTFVEMKKDGVGGVDGLDGVDSIVVDSFGQQVYATGYNDSALAVFSRNPTTGALTFTEVKKDGVGGVDGLAGPSAVALSPDGISVYVSSSTDDAVALFQFEEGGTVTFIEFKKNGVDGVAGIEYATGVSVSPDGKNVYVTALFGATMAIFQRDGFPGALTYVGFVENGSGGVSGMDEPFFVTYGPAGKTLYVCGTGIALFERDPTTGALAFVEAQADPEFEFYTLAASADGRHFYAGGNSAVMHFQRNTATGALRYLDIQADTGSGANLGGASGIAVSPGISYAYVTARDDDALNTFYRGDRTGLLYFQTSAVDGVGSSDGLDGAEVVAADSYGAEAFAAAVFDGALSRYYYGSSLIDVEFEGVGGADGLWEARSIVLSPDDAHIYVVGRSDAKIGVYKRNAPYSVFSFVEVQEQGVGGVDGLNLPYEIAISPDGKHVYVTSFENSSIVVFQRNASTGSLSFVQVVKDGVGGVDGLWGALWPTVSPDGAHVYATSANDQSVAIFARNPVSGALTFVGTNNALFPTAFPNGGPVKVSPDGNFVYTVGWDGTSTLLLFRRDPGSGLLTYLTRLSDNNGSVDGLDSPSDMAVSPDGRFIYVTADVDDAVGIFRQSCGDGVVDTGEECDDGNVTSGDCCSGACQFESASCSVILGKSVVIKDRFPGVDPTKRSVVFKAIELGSIDPLAGNPIASGATLELAANGYGSTRQTFVLPAGSNWRAVGSVGFKYADPHGANGPVKSLLIKKTSSSKFTITTKLSGAVNPVDVVPPNLGTDAGLKLIIPGGRTYCARLGGLAGGTTPATGNDVDTFKIVSTAASPAAEAACP